MSEKPVDTRAPQNGYVYFITDGHAIKIGFSINPISRLRDLQVSHHFELQMIASIKATPRMERMFHKRFSALRIRGEWFRPGKALTEFIEDLDRENKIVEFEHHWSEHEGKRLRKVAARRVHEWAAHKATLAAAD